MFLRQKKNYLIQLFNFIRTTVGTSKYYLELISKLFSTFFSWLTISRVLAQTEFLKYMMFVDFGLRQLY